MSGPYNASGDNGISVADAKAYIASIDSDAIQDQITHYTNIAASLNALASAVVKINSNLQATWSGAAAEAADTQFGTMAAKATNLASVLMSLVVPVLNDAHAGALKAQAAIKGVDDEVTSVMFSPSFGSSASVGLPGSIDTIFPAVASQVATQAEKSSGNMTRFQAEAFNAKQRAAGAQAMNMVAVPYTASAEAFTSAANGLAQDSISSQATGLAGGFVFGSVYGGGESSGLAHEYHVGFGNARREKIFPATTLQDYVPLAKSLTPPVVLPPPGGAPSSEPDQVPLSVFGERSLPRAAGGGSASSGSGFDEVGLVHDTGGGIVPRSIRFGVPPSAGAEIGVVGGTPAEADAGSGSRRSAGQFPSALMGGGRSGGGIDGGERERRGQSPAFLRGRFLDDWGEAKSALARWETPAIGGSEGVLIGTQSAPGSRVTSVYADAQDSQGNPLRMTSGSLGAGLGSGDESGEAGLRPGSVKEDLQ